MVVVTIPGDRLEDPMANKDKGGRSTKKAAGKSLKEKRRAKQAKRTAQANTGNKSVENTFDH